MNALQDAVDAGYDEFGEAANHTDRETRKCTPCVVVPDHNLQQWGETVSIADENTVIAVRRSEICRRPRRGDSFTLTDTGQLYLVDQVLNVTRYEFEVLVVEDDSRV